MPQKRKRKKGPKKGHKRKYHFVFILFLIAAAIFFFFEDFEKEKAPEHFFDTVKPHRKGETMKPGRTPSLTLPKIAIVIDDLGPSKKLAEKVLNLPGPITLSILPQQKYSIWIAQEGNRLGRDVIVHLPMQASRPLKLGEGGLYTWMDNDEIRQTVKENIRSVPHLTGASNHMGSAFTEDMRVMEVVIGTLKDHRLLFLDSLTTPESVGYDLAKAEGLTTLRRDIFLDDTDTLRDIEIQWKRMMRIAEKTGSAIAIGHPKKNTLEFLQKALDENNKVTVVPISDLASQ